MEGPTRAEWKTVILDQQAYPVVGDVTVTEHATFPGKITFGAHDKDSDDILAAWITGPDLTGGGQIWELNEGSDQNRFWDGVCNSLRGNGIALPPEVIITRPAGVANTAVSRPLGDVNSRYYHCFDAAAHSWDETNDLWGAANALDAAPVNKGVAFEGWLYAPMGSSTKGYQRVKESAPGALTIQDGPSGASKITAIAFAEWDHKLFAVEHDGTLSFTVDGTTWSKGNTLDAAGNKKRKLDASKRPTQLIEFTNRAGAPTLHVLTREALYSYYAEAERLQKTPMTFPPHPDAGQTMAVWRPGEDLWIGSGLEAHRWTASNVRAPLSGLSRDEGLPAELAGKIVDLEPEQSCLYALLKGNPAATTGETWVAEEEADDPAVFPDGSAYTALYANNGYGWHCLWRGDPTANAVTWARVSGLYDVEDSYRLWWGVGPDACTMKLSRAFLNPREDLRRGTGRYGPTGFIETGWFDAAMASFAKKAARVVVRSDYATTSETIALSYRTHPDQGWTQIGTVTASSEDLDDEDVTFELDPDGDGYPEGLRFRRIQLRADLARHATHPEKSPILDAIVLHFRKLPQRTLSHTFTVALPREPWGDGRTGQQMFEELDALTNAPYFPQFVHQVREGIDASGQERKPLRVDVTQVTKGGATGEDYAGVATVTVIEIVAKQKTVAA